MGSYSYGKKMNDVCPKEIDDTSIENMYSEIVKAATYFKSEELRAICMCFTGEKSSLMLDIPEDINKKVVEIYVLFQKFFEIDSSSVSFADIESTKVENFLQENRDALPTEIQKMSLEEDLYTLMLPENKTRRCIIALLDKQIDLQRTGNVSLSQLGITELIDKVGCQTVMIKEMTEVLYSDFYSKELQEIANLSTALLHEELEGFINNVIKGCDDLYKKIENFPENHIAKQLYKKIMDLRQKCPKIIFELPASIICQRITILIDRIRENHPEYLSLIPSIENLRREQEMDSLKYHEAIIFSNKVVLQMPLEY